jgi:energy-coupling factor transporter ATP-binding protein EcfA2
MKIAFTGSHGTGKTTASNMLKEIIKSIHPSMSVETLGSATRNVLEWGTGGLIVSPGSDSFQLVCIYERRNQMLTKESLESDFVISERWAMDENAYQLYKVKKYPSIEYSSPTLKVCKMELEWELENYWDIIYYIPVDDRLVEEDGIRPGDKDYQLAIDRMLGKVMEPYVDNPKFRELPTNLNSLREFFIKEVKSWEL